MQNSLNKFYKKGGGLQKSPIINMKKQEIVLKNETGLHARPAAELAKIAGKYQCAVNLYVGDKKINAKSILNIMAAGIKASTKIEIECDGPDENEALKEIVEAFNNNFGE